MLNPSTPTPEVAYDDVKRRVDKFKALPKRTRDTMNEEATKQGYILPLFRALGWDTSDPDIVSPEEKVSRGRVDYAFRIGNTPRFFLETKKAAEDITKPLFVKQAIDYAWTKGVTWALLSDFEGLRVFNAEWKESDPLHAQFLEFTLESYLTDFERLWWLSRPETEQKRLDREAEKVFKKAPRTPITASLFKHLIDSREKLYKNFALYNKHKLTTPKMIDDAVQRMLDRLIFIRTAEDRGVEGEKLIALVREVAPNKLLPALHKRFRELDGVYNSQLFASNYSDDLDCEADTLTKIIEGLYTSPANYADYGFDAIDADVLGRVYEQYLGYVFSEQAGANGHSPLLEAKRAKRKSQGIYYTPTFVVKYIVQQTLGRYLEEHGYNPSRPVRVLDPACGSGSFLIEAFDILDRYLARTRNQAQGQYDVIDYARQVEILTTNIYGVDKDEQAVEVARLNLLLKALHVRDKLPMLKHIEQGDSLISGTPKELEAYFGAKWKDKHPFNWQKEFAGVFEGANSHSPLPDGGFDVIIGNPPYIRIQTLPKDEVAFYNDNYVAATGNYDIYVLFVERALQMLKPNGVFGMILPKKFMQTTYGEGLRKLLAEQKAVWKIVDFGDAQVFEEATTYTCLLFLHKRENEKLVYLQAGDWLKAQDAAPNILPNDLPEQIISAAVLAEPQWSFSAALTGAIFDKLEQKGIPLRELAKLFVGLQTSADQIYILEERAGSTKRYVSVYSRATDRVYKLEREVVVPLLKGSLDMRRYRVEPITRYVIFPYQDGVLVPAKEFAESYPNCWSYLNENRDALAGREPKKLKAGGWYGYVYPKNLKLFGEPKILTPSIANRASFSYDERGEYYFVGSGGGGGGGYGIIFNHDPHSLLYFLGLLNSHLLDFYLKSISSPFRQGYYAYNKQYIERLPIRRINSDDSADKAQHDQIVALVVEMLQLQKEYATANILREDKRLRLKEQIDELDREIDRAVYALYGLTKEEIRIVEERAQ